MLMPVVWAGRGAVCHRRSASGTAWVTLRLLLRAVSLSKRGSSCCGEYQRWTLSWVSCGHGLGLAQNPGHSIDSTQLTDMAMPQLARVIA